MNKRKIEKRIYKMNKLYTNKKYLLSSIYSKMIRLIYAAEIPNSITIEENVEFVHNGLGCVLHPKCILKKGVKIYQNVTIGGNGKIVNGKVNKGAPILEENVAVFSGACVLGPIRIGHDSIIGANSVITKDVPPNSLVIGNPAIIKELKIKYNFD